MRCEYSDGLKVNYSGPIQIVKGEEVDIFIKGERIPDSIKYDLEMALYRNRCGAMREAAESVIRTFGNKVSFH